MPGGRREGAGRPRKADKYAGAIAKAEDLIASRLTRGRGKDSLPGIVDRMIDLASGVTIQETSKEGQVTIYSTAPDYRACAYLIDRIMGKATERQELSGPEGQPLWFTDMINRAQLIYGEPEDKSSEDDSLEEE